jgi:eukaryotic-like serine/threonine-protein kinase
MASQDNGPGFSVEDHPNSVSPEVVRAELQRILSNALFLRSDRLSRFLSFVVEQTLGGQQNGLKEYQIGIAVCGRSESYDQRTDPVVRVEARRLRSALDSYYANEGHDDPVLISLPKGGYVPAFAECRSISPPKKKPAPASSRARLAVLAGAAVFVALGGVASLFWHMRSKSLLTDKDTVVVAEFINETGDPVFNDALTGGLASQLAQSPFLNLLSDSRAAQTIALMAQDKEARLTADVARQVCERTGSTATIEGSISTLGGQYVLNLKAVNCHDGDVLAQEQVTANSKEQVLTALASAATQLRKKLGESLASVQKFDAPPENVTTPSLEALQAYSVGFKVHVVDLDEARAAELFQRAVSLDPHFAMAYARLATCYINLGEPSRAAEAMCKAYELRDSVSEHEKLSIVSQYQRFVTGNLEAARKTDEMRAEIYPHDDIPIGNLGNVYFSLGQYDKALAATKEALQRNPGSRIWHGNLVNTYIGVNQLQNAKATADESRANQMDSPWLNISSYLIDFLQHNPAGMQRDAALLKNQPGFEDVSLYYQAQAAAYEGRLNDSRDLTRRAIDSATRAGQIDSAAVYTAEEGVREALAGNTSRAKQQAKVALGLSHSRDTEAVAAIALGLAGDSAEATRLADGLLQRFPEDTLAQSIYLPMIRATVALHGSVPRKRTDAAIEALAASAPYELGSRAMSRVAFLTCYPAYFRGEAYLATEQGGPAVLEFQKIINNPQLTTTDPIGAFAFLGQARAYALTGDKFKSAAAYQKFLALWKDADADNPILRQAVRQYGALQK